MYREILEKIGLSPNEARIYEGLIGIKEASVPEISLRIGVHKRNVYDIIPKLLTKGLVYQVADSKENKYAPVEPDKLFDLIWEKEEQLKSILPSLNAQFKKKTDDRAVYVYSGREGFKNYLKDILRAGKDVYFIGAKGGWFDRDLQVFIKKFLKQAKEKKITYHHIFDAEVKSLAPDILKTLGKPYRFLPPNYSTTGAVDIFGDYIVTFSGLTIGSIDEDVRLAVIKNRELADCYRTWFKFIWDHCESIE